MFCMYCGKPVEGDVAVCSDCAAKKDSALHEDAPVQPAQPQQPEQPQEQPQQPVQPEQPKAPAPAEPDTFNLNTYDTEPPKKAPKKKKKGLVAGIIAFVIVAAAAVGIALNMDSIKGFVGRTVQSPEEYLAEVEQVSIDEHTAELTQSYGKILDSISEQQTSGTAEIAVTLGDSIISLLETTIEQQGMSMDLDWLQNISLSVNTNIQNDAMQMGLGLGLGKNNLLSADVIYDLTSSVVFFAIPELNEDYFYLDAYYYLPTDEIYDVMSQSQQMRDALVKALPSEETLNNLVSTYAGIVLAGIEDVEKESDTISVGEASQKMTILTAKITQEDLLDIAETVLKKAEKDKDIKKILNAFSDFVNEVNAMNGGYGYTVDLYQEFVDSIPYMLEQLEYAKEDANRKNYIKLITYVDMKGNVRGHEISVYTDGEKMTDPISWLTAVDGNTTYTEATISSVKITGEKVEKNGVSEGSYDVRVDGEKIGTLKFEDVTESSGTLQLVPGEYIMSEIMNETGVPASLLGNSVALELVYDTEGSSIEVNILAGGKTLIGLSISGKASKGSDIILPDYAFDIESDDDIMYWLQDANFENILANMEKAGVPSELVGSLRGYLDYIMYYMYY